jgi:YegS/Rv2252/BmrU family lipid kinase
VFTYDTAPRFFNAREQRSSDNCPARLASAVARRGSHHHSQRASPLASAQLATSRRTSASHLQSSAAMTTTNRRTVHLIANPNAGRGGERRARHLARFRELLKQRGVETELALTRAPDDATRLAREAIEAGAREIVVSGGDGTINEALQAIVGTDARLGILPAGTANVLARELKLPFDAERAAELIARGATRKVYAGLALVEATGARRYFIIMAGVGLDASIVRRVRPRLKRRVGEAAYWFSGFSHLADWQPVPFEVEIDGETLPATFAAVGKAPRYGGDLSITPRARLDAPEFEVCVINSRSRLRYLSLLPRVMRGDAAATDARSVRYLRATRVRAAGEGVLVQADGELIGELPMTFEIVNDPITLIAPDADDQPRKKIGYRNLR